MASYSSQFSVARLWKILAASMVLMFGVLLYFGNQIYHLAPPIPNAVKSDGGVTLFTREQIERGQNVWQSMGGMQQGSIWGHGSYVAPDWSADWLHREALRVARPHRHAASSGVDYEALSAADQARARTMLRQDMRTNTYDAQSGVVTVTNDRAAGHRGGRRALRGAVSGKLGGSAGAAGAVRIPGPRQADGGRIGRAERILLLDVLGGEHEAARDHDHVHEQLAA